MSSTVTPTARTEKVAADFNRKSGTWVARHTRLVTMPLSSYRRCEHLYAYGKTAPAALAEVFAQLPRPFRARLVVRQPDRKLRRYQVLVR